MSPGHVVALILGFGAWSVAWFASLALSPGWWCAMAPWHLRWEHVRWLSSRAELQRCRCGKEYAINHHMQMVIPYDDQTRKFYETFGGRMF